MAKINLTLRKLSDLIFHEANSPYVGYDRADLNRATVTVAGADVLTLGTPVFRAKSATANGKWAPVKANTALVTTNEFALVIADGLGEQLDVSGAGDHDVTLLVRGPVMVKDAKVRKSAAAVGLTVTADQNNLIHLLRAQGILPEITIA
jgi:hypothetical protein